MDSTQTQASVEQLVSIWTETGPVPDTTQLTQNEAIRNQQMSQAEALIAAEQKQVQANDQAIDAAEKKVVDIDLDIARLKGREEQMEK